MSTFMLPALNSRADSWPLANYQKEKVAMTQRSMERSSPGKTDNKEVRPKTQVHHRKSTEHKGSCRKSCENDERQLVQEEAKWRPREGSRMKGRPKQMWRAVTKKKAGSKWTHLAQDRQAWKQLLRSPVQTGVASYNA